MSTTAICRMTRSLLADGVGARTSSKDSAQSPAWSRNASPRGDLAPAGREVAGLAGEHERGAGRRSASATRSSVAVVGPVGLLRGSAATPGRGCHDAGGSSAGSQRGTSVCRCGRIGSQRGPPTGRRDSGLGATSGGVDARRRPGRGRRVDGPLHEAAGGLGGDAELLADLAVAALAPVVRGRSAARPRSGPGCRARRAGSVTICSSTRAITASSGPWRRRRPAGRRARCRRRRRWCGRATSAW